VLDARHLAAIGCELECALEALAVVEETFAAPAGLSVLAARFRTYSPEKSGFD
jgi:hypothetical protein